MKTTPVETQSLSNLRHYSWREIGSRFWPLVKPYRGRSLFAVVMVSGVGLIVAQGGTFARLYRIATATSTRALKLEEAGFA